MNVSQYNNFYTNQVSNKVADELIARMDALSALNRNVSDIGSSKQFFSVRDRNTARPELLRKFQEWRDRRIAFGEVRAFRKVSTCCNQKLVKKTEPAPFVVTVKYDDENGIVPVSETNTEIGWKSYADIKYSASDGLNRPSFYNGQPQIFLQSINVSNEGYAGVVKRVVLKMRVFTKEAFEIADKWFLRPGNEVLVKYGWSVPLTSVETATDVIHGVIFNFNATVTDDGGWNITVHAIAKGNLAVGIALGSSAEAEAIEAIQQSQENGAPVNVIPNLTSILKEEINKIKVKFPSLQYSDESGTYGEGDRNPDGDRSGIIYESTIFPHGIGRIKHAISNEVINNFTENVEEIKITPPASDQEFNGWLETFRAANPEFKKLEETLGTASPSAFIQFYRNNFGFVDATIPSVGRGVATEQAVVFPNRADISEVETFINKPNVYFTPTRTSAVGTSTAILENEKRRPPIGRIRRRVLDLMYTELPDNRTDAQKQQEQFLRNQAKAEATAIEQDTSRVTSPTSTSRYYICLGDLVYFFNDIVIKNASELYESVQLLVENQPTSYDPEVVSAFPDKIIFSDVRPPGDKSMSVYGMENPTSYGFKYRRNSDNQFESARGCNGYDFYTPIDREISTNLYQLTSKDDMDFHTPNGGILSNGDSGDLIAAYNIAHIWISVDVISEKYNLLLKDKSLDPQYKTLFEFFNEIFKVIAQSSGNIIQLTLVPDNNELYGNNTLETKTLSNTNPILNKVQFFKIVDVNYQVPDGLPSSPSPFNFKLNDVNATILRDVTVSLKLPSKLQTVAYTYGRSGLNDEIVDVADDQGICIEDYTKLKNKEIKIVQDLEFWKTQVALTTNEENMYNLQNALELYRKNPMPVSDTSGNTSYINTIHQAWIYSKLYPVELQIKLDGISGFLYGNKINVLNVLPSRYNNSLFFTVTKIEHSVQDHDWITTITAIARLRNSNQTVQFPRVLTPDIQPDDCGETTITTASAPISNTGIGRLNSGMPAISIPPMQRDATEVYTNSNRRIQN